MAENFEIMQDGKILSQSKEKEDVFSDDDMRQLYISALKKIKDNEGLYSVVNNSENSGYSETLSKATIKNLSDSPQDSLSKTLSIASYARMFINKNDLIGKTYDAIENNTNTNYKLSYNRYDDNRNKNKRLQDVKNLIEDFNEHINLKALIRTSVPLTYAEGNYITYLRGDKDTGYTVDYYPLGICEVSDFCLNGYPVLLMNIDELRKKLKPDNVTKDIFNFKTIEDIIKNNYPPEVVDAFLKKQKYAMLNPSRAGIMRIGNMKRKYGVSPILRAFEPITTLEGYEIADNLNSKAKAKKVIWQKMRKELFEKGAESDIMGKVIFAHNQLIGAWKNNTVLYSAPPWVEDLQYVEPNTSNTSVDTLVYQRNRIFVALGISYLNEVNASVTGGKISVEELMKSINKISEQLEDIMKRYYKVLLLDNGYNEKDAENYIPDIDIIDSEQMDWDIRQSLASLLYTKLNCSLETTLNVLGYNVKDEYDKRLKENENNYDDIFKARATSYTVTNDDKSSGRPADKDSNNPNKQALDKENRN